MLNFDPDKLWPIYEKLPEDLKDAIFSEQTADTISAICQRNNIEEKETSAIAKYIGYVLLGVVRRSEFPTVLQTEVPLSKDIAEKIVYETNQFIFFPLKASLDFISPEENTTVSPGAPKNTPQKTASTSRKKISKDSYREAVE